MHIPDGYLSPATCATLYAASAPFWFSALKRVERMVNARLVPMLSLVSAFSFVVMMFNIPLPGGTSGHAVGMAVSAIVLGPWASMLAISVALLIQAVFFGDGGVTAFGANCFNMAIVGSLVAYGIYRAIAGRSPITSPRRVVAGALAGYIAINAAAVCAAIEFGIQPSLFHDATGTPLYAPYPLHIALPAMLIGHLTIAGLAEAAISGGIVAYLQRANTALLQTTSGLAENGSGWRSTRRLWLGMAALMILTPLGLLAAGTAWGEWAVDDFKNPAVRAEIAAASQHVAPPEAVPAGIERLASVWTAPIPDYAPTFLKSERVGYILSAIVGCGLIIAAFLALDSVVRLAWRKAPPESR